MYYLNCVNVNMSMFSEEKKIICGIKLLSISLKLGGKHYKKGLITFHQLYYTQHTIGQLEILEKVLCINKVRQFSKLSLHTSSHLKHCDNLQKLASMVEHLYNVCKTYKTQVLHIKFILTNELRVLL